MTRTLTAVVATTLCLVLSACATAEVAAPPPPPAPPENLPKPGLRLSSSIRPTRAELLLDVDPTRATTSGKVTYSLELPRAEAVVWINATDLVVTKASFGSVGGHAIAGDEDVVGIVADAPVGPGKVEMTLEFTGKVDKERSRGIYRGDEGADAYLYTFFESIDARRAFPCFDEPAFKIPWTLSLRVPKADVAIANAAAVAEKDNGDGTKTVAFAQSKPLPSYLVAFGVGPFELIDGGTAGDFKTPFRIAVPRGLSSQASFALQSTPRIISILESYFGMPYPYGKLDVLVVPRYWGTMEHPGIVAIGQPISLIKPEDNTVARQEFYVDIGGHELCHYWFGDYVTMAWWDDTWLNEALGEWMDAKLTSAFEPKWAFMNDRLAETESARSKDGLATAKSIRQPVETKEAIWSAFDADLTYTKGSAVLRMFEYWVGEEPWKLFIRSYLAAHAWGNATTDDFLSKMGEKLSPQAAAAFKTFLSQPGIPLVSAEVHCEGKPYLSLSQSRYQPLGQTLADETWQIPVCWRTEAGRACTLLDQKKAEVPLDRCPQFLAPNAGELGYYRVSYTPETATALLPHLEIAERNGLADDVKALVRASRFPLADALALIPPLVATGERHAIEASLDLFHEVRTSELDDAQMGHVARFLEKTYGARARALGWTSISSESPDDALLRPLLVQVLASQGEDPQLVAQAAKLAEAWISTRKGLSNDLAGGALRVAARHGDRTLFERLLAEAKKPTTTLTDRSQLLGALGSFRQPELAKAALAEMPSFDMRESGSILWAVAITRETRNLAWAALQQGFDTWTPKMRGDETASLILIAAVFCDAEHRTQAAAFYGPRVQKLDGGPINLSNLLNRMDVCIAVKTANEPTVSRFLLAQ